MAKVDFSNIEPNSKSYHYDKEKEKERIKIDPVIKKEKIVSMKKPLGKRVWDLFVGIEPKDLRDYLIHDVLIPGAKDALIDAVSMALNGEPISRRRGRVSSGFGRVSYQNCFAGLRERAEKKERNSRRDDEKIDYRDIVLESRADAEMIVDHMLERIKNTGSVSVAEFYDMLELPSKFTDNDWGWDDDRDIGVKKVYGGWLIDVREAKHLD